MDYSGYVQEGCYDEVALRGDVAKGEFILFWLRDGRVMAAMNVNIWEVTDVIQTLSRSGTPVDRVRLVNSEVPLAEVHAAALAGAR
jgi:3-phenylpropionate/trans-cinnamate dioxygenase ferredoxin reductase component